jgi:uncharacterized membrane protein YjgN (DUF898 family)
LNGLGAGLFPGYYVHLRCTLDGQLSRVECFVCCAFVLPWIALNGALLCVTAAMPVYWAVYFAFAIPIVDLIVCACIMAVIVLKRLKLKNFDAEMVQLLPGSAMRHNDMGD